MLLVLVALDDERALQLGRNLHIIISVYAQDILHDVAGTLHIHTIGRDLECQRLGSLVKHLHLQTLTDGLDGLDGNHLTHEVVDIVVVEFHHRILHRLGIDIADLHRDLTTRQFLTEDGGLLQGIDGAIGIDTTLEAEAGIRAQTMTTG